MKALSSSVFRCALAIAAVAATMWLRQALMAWVGGNLPPYIVFYPTVMAIALLAGLWPGLIATVLSCLAAAYWILPPSGEAGIASPADRLGLVIFAGMGLSVSVIAELYRRGRRKAAAYDRKMAVHESQARLATFAEATFEGVVESQSGQIVDCNEQFARMMGYSVAEIRGMEIANLVAPEDRERVSAILRQNAESVIEHVAVRKDGTRLIVEAHGKPESSPGGRRHAAVRDITERKRAEEDRALMTSVLRILNQAGDLDSVARETIRVIREATRFDAVGLRLRRGEDCPYFEQDGFSEDFLREENFLCDRGGDGAIIRDAEGKAVLECTCGLVLCARTDPHMTCFTRGGSFWTNVSEELLALPPEVDPRTNPRNRCIHIGYQSVGLFPIRAGKEIIGLLQLNDRQSGRFTPESIAFFETLAQNIGLGLQRTIAEETLRQSEEKFARAFANNPAATGITRVEDGVFLDVNETWLELTGYSREELIGHSTVEMNIWAVAEDRQKCVAELKANGFLRGREYEFRRKNGECFLVHLSAQVLTMQGQEVILTTLLDITDRRRAEQAIRESESRYRRLMQAIPVPLGVVSRSSEITYLNDRFTQVFGYTMADLPMLEDWWKRAYPDPEYRRRIVENWQAKVRRSEETGIATEPEEYNITCKDGTVRAAVITNLGIEDCTVAAFIDVTERKAAEEALRHLNAELEQRVAQRTAEMVAAAQKAQAERNRLFDVLETLPPMICLLTPDYHVAFANRSFRQRFGESNGRYCFDYCFGRTEPCDFCESYKVLSTGLPHQWEVHGADGSVIEAYDFPFTDADGSPMILEMDIDITERRRAEEAIRDLNETLERRVAERTEELRRSNEDLQQFAYVASHDLQEPLRMVTSFLQLLENRYVSQLDDNARQYINLSMDGATRMSQLIYDLLEFSRVGRDGRTLKPTATQAALNDALANLRVAIGEANATVQHDELPTVQGDPLQLTQLFQNLVGNAVKFRRSDRPCQVHVSACRQDGAWLFAVRDNGIGIAPKQQDRIFLIFQRLHARDKYAGTGIGLAVCKKIVERHGGRIWVDSTPDEGSTFYFTLPAVSGTHGALALSGN